MSAKEVDGGKPLAGCWEEQLHAESSSASSSASVGGTAWLNGNLLLVPGWQ